MSDSAPGGSSNAKAKLQMVLSRLLDGVTDDDLQKIQTEVDEMELRMKGDGLYMPIFCKEITCNCS